MIYDICHNIEKLNTNHASIADIVADVTDLIINYLPYHNNNNNNNNNNNADNNTFMTVKFILFLCSVSLAGSYTIRNK